MSLIGSRFHQIRIIEQLGRGGMGEVYVGFDETLQRKVAVKAIRDDRRLDATTRARFLREARILSQLEHPNICRIYDYVVHEQTELLVLELIEGMTLTAAIKQGLERKTKIDIAIAIAGVLAAAHAAGIIHRDLKPDNVMITPEGQVKVLDFGLARSEPASSQDELLKDADARVGAGSPGDATIDESATRLANAAAPTPDETMTVHHRLSASLGFDGDPGTAVGAIMGTPWFMSPEQARGETATTASDMFSFGLLLQTLFTGRSPYPGTLDLTALLLLVQTGKTRTPEGLGRDLGGLISSLKSLAPTARPTATDTVVRLRWIHDAPRRRFRLAAVAALTLSALSAGLKYTLDLRRERSIALAARSIADQRREQAEALIGFMLGDVREKLEPLGKLELLDTIGDKAFEYFASVPEHELSDVELARRAQALYQIGDVRIRQGNLAAAMPAFAQAVNLSDGLLQREPENEQWLDTSAQSRFWLGNGYWNRGELQQALAEFEAYRELSIRLAAQDPTDPGRKQEASNGEFNVGSVLEALGRLEPAAEHLSAATRIAGELVESDPARDDWRFGLAANHLLIGRVREALGELDAAQGHYDADLSIMETLTRRDPANTEWQEQLTIAHNHVGTLLERRAELSRAGEHFKACLALARKLAEQDSENFWWRGIVAIGERNLGRWLCRQGALEAGLASLRTARRAFEVLVERDTSRPQWRRELALATLDVSRAMAQRGETARALAEALAARASLAQLTTESPDDARPKLSLAEADLLLGDLHDREGRVEEARTSWTEAEKRLAPLAATSGDGTRLAPWAAVLLRLGREPEAAPPLEKLRAQGYIDPRLARVAGP